MNEIENLTINNRAYNIEIFSFSNTPFLDGNKYVSFPAFVTNFSDGYKSEWTRQSVLGKMDPIATFKNTKRTINIAFDIPSESIQKAKENLAKIDYIIRGQYPVYDNSVLGTATLSSPPMFRVRFGNLIRNSGTDVEGPKDNSDLHHNLRSGLLCYFDGFDFKPNIESGFFIESGENLYPKLISVSLSLNVIHEHPLGKSLEKGNIIKDRPGFSKFPRLEQKEEKDELFEALTKDLDQPTGDSNAKPAPTSVANTPSPTATVRTKPGTTTKPGQAKRPASPTINTSSGIDKNSEEYKKQVQLVLFADRTGQVKLTPYEQAILQSESYRLGLLK